MTPGRLCSSILLSLVRLKQSLTSSTCAHHPRQAWAPPFHEELEVSIWPRGPHPNRQYLFVDFHLDNAFFSDSRMLQEHSSRHVIQNRNEFDVTIVVGMNRRMVQFWRQVSLQFGILVNTTSPGLSTLCQVWS